MKKFGITLAVLVSTLPMLAFAQDAFSILGTFERILGFLIPLFITLGIVYFIYGVISYVMGSTDDAKKEGRNRMIYGIIGLFVIVSVWGLVSILGNTFGVRQGGGPSDRPDIVY